MEEGISKNLKYLCTHTIVDEQLLLSIPDNIMTEHKKDLIKSRPTPLEKSSAFYTYMKRRPEADFPALVQALRESGNDSPADVLEEFRKNISQPTTSRQTGQTLQSIQTTTGPEVNEHWHWLIYVIITAAGAITISLAFSFLTSSNVSSPGATLKDPTILVKVGAFSVAQTICKDNTIIRNWEDLKGPLKVQHAEFVNLKQGILNGTSRLTIVIQEMLDIWIGQTGKNATVKKFKEILKQQNFLNAAESLEVYPENAKIVTQ